MSNILTGLRPPCCAFMDTPEGRAGFLARLRAQNYSDLQITLAFLRAEMRRCQVLNMPGGEYAEFCAVMVFRLTEIIQAANRGRLDNGLLATDENENETHDGHHCC